MEHRTVTSLLPVSSTSGSIQVPRPGHFRLGALGGPTPVDFFYFSPLTTQCTHSAPRPGHSLPRITRGPDNCLLSSCMLTAQTSSLVSSTPTHTNLDRSTRGPDHGLRPSYLLLLPASTAPCPEHFQAKALGGLIGTNRAARTHLFSSSHNMRKLSQQN